MDTASRKKWSSKIGVGCCVAFSALAVGMIFTVIVIATRLRPVSDQTIGPIHDAAFFPDGARFATANQDGTLRIWDSGNGEAIHSLGRQRTAVTCLAISADGNQIAAGFNDWSRSEYGVIIWDAVAGVETRRFLPHAGNVNDVAFTPDGRRIVTASSDKTIRVTTIQDGTEVFCFRGHDADVNAVTISPSGHYLLSAAGDYWGGVLHDPSIRQWSLSDGSFVRVIARGRSAFERVAFSPDGTIVAGMAWDRVRIWDFESGDEIATVAANVRARFQCVAFHPSGQKIVTGSDQPGEAVQVWDIPNGKLLATFVTKTAAHGVAYSQDGKRLASTHGQYRSRDAPPSFFEGSVVEEGAAIIWDPQSGKEILRVAERRPTDN